MQTQPLTIQGLAGPLVVDANWFTGRNTITVGGRPATRTGRRRYALPTQDGGTVEGRVLTGLFRVFPAIEIAGAKYETMPGLPLALRIVAVLPIVLVVGGLIGALVGLGAVAINQAVIRGSQSAATKGILMGVVTLAAVVLWLIIAALLQSAY